MTERARRALICGVTGQDGAYLAALLLERGYEVTGTSRDAAAARREGLEHLGIASRVRIVTLSIQDPAAVLETIRDCAPDEVYNLAGQSSVGESFAQPAETIDSIVKGTLNLLEAIRHRRPEVRPRLYNAGSSECFGDTGDGPATERTPFRPRSPYAVAKACAHNLVANYREAYGLHACTGILFNHESPLRGPGFVTQKVVGAARRIAAGEASTATLGRLDIHRDWGWAPEYVEAMWRMLQAETADDYVIATGRTVSLEHFVERAFAHFGLDWRRHVRRDDALLRPTDIRFGAADPSLARARLGWRATVDVDEVVRRMCEGAASP